MASLCTKCKWADWRKTANGRLHPSGAGQCRYEWFPPPLPASMYFVSVSPKPSGGWIERKDDRIQQCRCFEQQQ